MDIRGDCHIVPAGLRALSEQVWPLGGGQAPLMGSKQHPIPFSFLYHFLICSETRWLFLCWEKQMGPAAGLYSSPPPHLWWTWQTACLGRVGCESIYSEKYRPVLFLCRATTIRQLLTVLVWFKHLSHLPKVLLGTLVTRECCCAVPLLPAELERIHVQDRV